jgi:hypothetical protein
MINYLRPQKFMKFVPNYKLGFSLGGKHLVPPGHGILLGLMPPFLRIKLRL